MKTLEFGKVAVDIHDGPLGVAVSGGADSAILLYIMMKNMEKNIPLHVFACSSKQKNRVSAHHTLDVIGKCIDMTGKENVECHINFVDVQTMENLFDPISGTMRFGLVNYVYTGVTALPPLDVCDTFQNSLPLIDRRDPRVIHETYRGKDKKFYVPFANINKSAIKDLYVELGCLEDLFPLTRSCESLTLTSGHCGECWWCEERFWAFGRYD